MRKPEFYLYDNDKKDVRFYDSYIALFEFIESCCFDFKWDSRKANPVWSWQSNYWPEDFFRGYGHCVGDNKRFTVKDKHGRTLNKVELEKSYTEWANRIVSSKSKRASWYGSFVFRCGYVNGISSHRIGHWRKMKGKHAGRSAIKRQWFRDEIYSKEIHEDFGITFKMDRKEFTHNRHEAAIGRSWKRSKGCKRQYLRSIMSKERPFGDV